jgi:hypothetical protein
VSIVLGRLTETIYLLPFWPKFIFIANYRQLAEKLVEQFFIILAVLNVFLSIIAEFLRLSIQLLNLLLFYCCSGVPFPSFNRVTCLKFLLLFLFVSPHLFVVLRNKFIQEILLLFRSLHLFLLYLKLQVSPLFGF